MRFQEFLIIVVAFILLLMVIFMSSKDYPVDYDGPIASTGATGQSGPIGTTGVDLSTLRIGCEYDCEGWK